MDPSFLAPPAAPEIKSNASVRGSPGATASPPPDHRQTVAALTHFAALENVLRKLLCSPSLGRSDMRSEIIDAASKLVAHKQASAADAVSLLGTFPVRPFEQKQWLEQHFIETVNGAAMVLEHHGQGFAGTQGQAPPPDDDGHLEAMSSLLGQYAQAPA